ncbi:hypothetical protein K9M59_04230 [Candidatus Gracilibacteria bacterium]|nr:hypothetical protein [Candidatus Gracilibacteria bacterium]MCF7819528.1 hypothetical protein [Candidatus Gracilibacteria bacterium]
MTLQDLTTKTGKTIQDFTIPEALLQDEELVTLIMGSESMSDDERQYWFNLTDVMTDEQVGKLRAILQREKVRLSEIEGKYEEKSEDPQEAFERAQKRAQQRKEEQKRVRQKETAHEAAERGVEQAALAELENL